MLPDKRPVAAPYLPAPIADPIGVVDVSSNQAAGFPVVHHPSLAFGEVRYPAGNWRIAGIRAPSPVAVPGYPRRNHYSALPIPHHG